jgi:hypothetical protein
MSRTPSNLPDARLLPALPPDGAAPADLAPSRAPARQLGDLPKEELSALAEEFGLDPSRYQTPQHLVAALHERRQVIASLDREAMLDVVRWAMRPVPVNASKEQLAQEIVRVKTMRFGGLSERGILILARLRGVEIEPGEELPAIVKKLKKQEGLFARLNRKRRAWIGGMVANMLGEDRSAAGDYQFMPPQPEGGATSGPTGAASRQTTIKEEIEEQGLFGGLAGRIRKSADHYVNAKLDEIEARIDRKLDEIDRRLGEWRDKEIANRIRILKITLWASVIVGVVSLLYSYIKVYIIG